MESLLVPIICSLITGGLSLVGVIITNSASNNKMQADNKAAQAVVNNKIENLNLLTSQDNNNWGTRNERSRQSQINNDEKSKKVKVYKYPSMEFIGIFPSRKEIERKLKCFNVKKVIDGIYKQEKGYTFSNV